MVKETKKLIYQKRGAKRLGNWLIMSLIICAELIFMLHLYAQGNYTDKPVETISGQISQINWVGSRITIRWLQPNGITVYDDETFSVPRNANITRNGQSITLSDAQIGDNATVEYIDAGFAGLRAVNISIVK